MTAHYADVSDPDSVEACIAEIIAEHGKIDNLVTSAGFTENFEAVAYPIDRMRKLWGVNVDGTYLFATTIARHLVSSLQSGMGIIRNRPRVLTILTSRWSVRPRVAWFLSAA